MTTAEANAFDLKSIAQSLIRLSEARRHGDGIVHQRRQRATAFSSTTHTDARSTPSLSKRRSVKNRFAAPTVIYDSESDDVITSADSATDSEYDEKDADLQRMQMAAPSSAAIDADDIGVAMTLGSLNHVYEQHSIDSERERIERLNRDVANAITDASTSLIALSKSRLRLVTDSMQHALHEVQSQSRAHIADEMNELTSLHQKSERNYANKVQQIIAAEEEARREAERQARLKAEAEARAELARRAAEERKREEAAAAAAATAQAQVKAAAEAKAKAAADEKKKASSLLPAQQPGAQAPSSSSSTLSPADATAAAAAAQAAQAEMQPRLDLLQQYRAQAATFTTNPNQKLQIKVIINRTITQISGTQQSILQKVQILITQLNNAKNTNIPSLYCYTLELIANKITSSAETRIATQTSIAFPIAQVALHLSFYDSNFHSIFLASLTERCVYIIPLYLDRKQYTSMSAYKHALGYASDTEDEEKYFERMCGFIALYAAYVQSTSSTPHQHQGMTHPHGITSAWRWLARFCNHEPRTATAAILHTFLSVAGYMLYQTYPQQMRKIFYYIATELLPRMDTKTPARNASFIRLKLWIEETTKNLQLGKTVTIPEGQNIPFTQSSDAAVQVIQRGD